MLIVSVLCPPAFLGQTRIPERGPKPTRPFSTDEIDSVNLTNGNVFLSIPLASLPKGRGDSPDFPISLNYNSKLWDMRRELRFDGIPDEDGNTRYFAEVLVPAPNGGWSIGIGYRLVLRTRSETEAQIPCDGSVEMQRNAYAFRLELQSPDGSDILMRPDGFNDMFGDGYFNVTPNGTVYQWNYATVGAGSASCNMSRYQSAVAMTYRTVDGSQLRLTVTRMPGGMSGADNPWILYRPDGVIIENRPPDDPEVLQRMTDRNGNRAFLKKGIFNGVDATVVEDDIGRRTVVQATPTGHSVFRSGFKGELLETKVEWQTVYVQKVYNAAESAAINAPPSTRATNLFQPMSVVARLVLPVQTGGLHYSFDYNASEQRPTDAETDGWGELKSVTLPTGAETAYRYRLDGGQSRSSSYHVLRNTVVARTLRYLEEADGVTTPLSETRLYSIGSDSSVVTDADGYTTVTRFVDTEAGSCDAGLVLSTRHADGSVTENLWTNRCRNPWVQFRFDTVPDSKGNPALTSAVSFLRDVNGNLLEERTFGYAPYASVPRMDGRPTSISSDMPLLRTVVNEFYAPSSRLKRTLKSTEIRDSAGIAVSRSEYEYDDSAVRGNVTVARKWDSAKGMLASADLRGFRLGPSNSVTSTASYDAYGNAVVLTDGRGVQTEIVFGRVEGTEGLYPTEIIEASRTSVASKTASEYDISTGLVTRKTFFGNTSAENLISEFLFDAFGRPIRWTEAIGTATARSVSYQYDGRRRVLVTRGDRDKPSDGKEVTADHYDQLGRLRLHRQLEDDSQDAFDERRGIKVQTRRRVIDGSEYVAVSNPYRAEVSSDARAEESMGWRITRSDRKAGVEDSRIAEGADAPFPWGTDRATRGTATSVSDADMRMVTDEAGVSRISRFDAIGNITETWELTSAGDGTVIFGDTALRGLKTTFSNDPLGNLVKIDQGRQRRIFNYDSLSRMVQAVSPEAGATTFRHDANGNITLRTDARGVGTYMTYDALNRIVSEVSSAASATAYSASPKVFYSYDDSEVPFAKGRLTRVYSDASDLRSLAFDPLGRQLETEQTTDGVGYRISYAYNLAGELVKVTYPSGRVIKTHRGAGGRIAKIEGHRRRSTGMYVFASDFTYLPSGAVSGIRLGNGLREKNIFNPAMNLERVSLGRVPERGDVMDLKLSYALGADNGNVTAENLAYGSSGAFEQRFSYDELNRLSSAAETADLKTRWKQVFLYDRFGNRRFDERSTTTLPRNCLNGAQPIICTADRKRINPSVSLLDNRLVSDQDRDGLADFNYDASGNVTKEPSGLNFVYDSDQRLVRVEDSFGNMLSTFQYDGLGRRVKKTTFVNNRPGAVTVFVYDSEGRTLAEYSNRIESSVSAKLAYLTADHLGSPRISTDPNGRVISKRDYLPFGEEIDRTDVRTDGIRKGFTGYERDDESALYFAGARHYSYSLGRFTGSDPMLGNIDPSLPQGFNRYAYALNNPLRFIDPSGKDWIVNTSGDRAANPYRWVDRCGVGQSCWTTIAYDTGAGVRVYGTRGSGDIATYAANERGQVNVDVLFSHKDSKVESVAMSQGIPEAYLSTRAATAFYNLGVRYRARFPNDGKLVFTNGNAADGKPCTYGNGKSCHSGHRGNDADFRYMDGAGNPLIGASAYLSADPKRMRFILEVMKEKGFPESFSGSAVRLGTNPASPRTEKMHRNHLHIGVDDSASTDESTRRRR